MLTLTSCYTHKDQSLTAAAEEGDFIIAEKVYYISCNMMEWMAQVKEQLILIILSMMETVWLETMFSQIVHEYISSQ